MLLLNTQLTDAPKTKMLIALLQNGNHLLATYDRDRIFALLGIVSHYSKRIPSASPRNEQIDDGLVDYTKSTGRIYQELAKRMINSMGSFAPLCTTYIDQQEYDPVQAIQRLCDLPSWTPDWRTVTMTKTVTELFHQLSRSNVEQYVTQDLNQIGWLSMKGHVLGEVVLVLDDDSRSIRNAAYYNIVLDHTKQKNDGYVQTPCGHLIPPKLCITNTTTLIYAEKCSVRYSKKCHQINRPGKLMVKLAKAILQYWSLVRRVHCSFAGVVIRAIIMLDLWYRRIKNHARSRRGWSIINTYSLRNQKSWSSSGYIEAHEM